jgi:ribokinase
MRGVSVLALRLESPIDAVTSGAELAHERGMNVLLNLSPYRSDAPSALLESTDVLLVNEHELESMTVHSVDEACDCSKVDADLAARGTFHAIVTMGAHGSVVIDDDVVISAKTLRVKAVDSTGCGDAYMDAVLAGLASGYSLVNAVRLASCVLAYVAKSMGAQASYGMATQVGALLSWGPTG